MMKIAVALAMVALTVSPTLAQTHRHSENVYRQHPSMQFPPASDLGYTGEYNGRSEARGGG